MYASIAPSSVSPASLRAPFAAVVTSHVAPASSRFEQLAETVARAQIEAEAVAPAPVAATPARDNSLEGWTAAAAKEALAKYEGLVRTEARRLRAPALRTNTLDEEDLRAEGRVAVLEALRRFQGWGVNESTWVRMRVRQRMVDAVRKTSLWSRLDSRVVAKGGRGEDLTTRERARAESAGQRQLVSFDAAPEGHSSLADTMADSTAERADDVVEQNRRATSLRRAIAELPARARTVVERVLIEGQPARDVAAELGVSESRISQILHGAVPQLRTLLGELPA